MAKKDNKKKQSKKNKKDEHLDKAKDYRKEPKGSGESDSSYRKRAKAGFGDAIQLAKDSRLAKPDRTFTVGLLEEALLREFPAEDACHWDRTGLVVGERGLAVRKAAVALDVTVSAIEQASKRGADVLVTHHPVFLDPPETFSPDSSIAIEPGALVWAAIRNKIALMDFHTALDVSPAAQGVLPSMLGLNRTGHVIEPTSPDRKKGFGHICKVERGHELLSRLAARAMSVFGRAPRVWGDFDRRISRVVTATGSAGDIGRLCIDADIDCLICGEIKYHEAPALSEAGLSIIELGHDVSELPLVAVLAEALAKAGMHRDDIVIIDQSDRWSTPEAIRV